jgi:hypothetical protein
MELTKTADGGGILLLSQDELATLWHLAGQCFRLEKVSVCDRAEKVPLFLEDINKQFYPNGNVHQALKDEWREIAEL